MTTEPQDIYVQTGKYLALFYLLCLSDYVLSVMRDRLPEKFGRGRVKSLKNENCEKLYDPFDESLYKFKPGYIPPQKQVFYQVNLFIFFQII